MEYTRKIQPTPGAEGPAAGGEDRVLAFGNVELLGAKEGEDKNAAEMAVARGFATVIRHRTDEERSSVYERLIELEEAAKTAKRGLHSNKASKRHGANTARRRQPGRTEVAAPRLNDVSLPGNAARAKQYLPFFQRSGRVAATVEYVLSGHRLKIEVEGVDKGGTFLGTITLPGAKPVNLGLSLLRQGLAKLQPFFSSDRVKGGAELEAAQNAAKQAHLKIWESWTPEDDKVEGDDDDEAAEGGAAGGSGGEVLSVT
ncbi:transcriptional coactivator-like protein, partial [Monoraphidium neglectum]